MSHLWYASPTNNTMNPGIAFYRAYFRSSHYSQRCLSFATFESARRKTLGYRSNKRGSPRTGKVALIFNVPTLAVHLAGLAEARILVFWIFEIVAGGDFESTTSLCNMGGSLSTMSQLDLGHCGF